MSSLGPSTIYDGRGWVSDIIDERNEDRGVRRARRDVKIASLPLVPCFHLELGTEGSGGRSFGRAFVVILWRRTKDQERNTEIHYEFSLLTLPKQSVVSVSSLSLSTYCRLDIKRSCLQTIPLAIRKGAKALIENAQCNHD